jgi:phospholipid/cholesterol/gamma-HCH transport system substrate-binding protein
MSERRAFELKVGLFILIGIVILFFIVFSIGDIYFTKPGYHIKVFFNFASGIGPSSPVRVVGVGAGHVEGVQIVYDEKEKRAKAEVYAWIQESVKIEDDALVTINQLGLLGEKYLEIFPGTPGRPFLKDNETIIGRDPVSMDKVTDHLAKLSESVSSIVGRLENGEGTVGKLLTDDTIYKNLVEFTDDIKRHPWKLLAKPRGE